MRKYINKLFGKDKEYFVMLSNDGFVIQNIFANNR